MRKFFHVFLALALLSLIAACGKKGADEAENSTTNSATDEKTTAPKAEGRYKTGDVLYCYAPSGLILRDKPDQAGAKLASVPRDGKVEVKDEAPFQDAFSVKEPCGLEIKGFWVKASIGGKEGYIFDGYLLKQRPLAMDETVEDYWSGISKVKSSTDKPPKNDVNYYGYNYTTWENGVAYESSGYEGGSNSVLTLPKGMFTFQEAYLLAIAGIAFGTDNPTKCTCDAGKQQLECNSQDELSLTELETDANGNYLIRDSYAD